MNEKKNVALAVSGGVDSAIAAILLKESGYNVIGINFQFWRWENNSDKYLHNSSLLSDLERKIGINIQVIKHENIFKEIVVKHFLSGLSTGITPNPCVRCNPLMKFHLLNEFAQKEDIEYISTGHYARVDKGNDGYYRLLKGFDPQKDQSYVLCCLTQHILSKTIFPLGESYKKDNLKIAKQLGLKSGNVGESQDLCFVSPDQYKHFIKESIPEALVAGNIIDKYGNILGAHIGLALYTIGQRKGIKISSNKPYYVLKKIQNSNQLVVGHIEDLGNSHFIVENVNWIRPQNNAVLSCDVKMRYRSQMIKCNLENHGRNHWKVSLTRQVRDITPGQYAVFYDGEEVLGGGVIREII
jgi:tRNA-uridine 2-sulfurtransferase